MKEFFRVFAFLYTCVYVFFMFPGLLFLWDTMMRHVGGVGIAIVLISLTINLILFWSLSGLEKRVSDLEYMHKEKDDDEIDEMD